MSSPLSVTGLDLSLTSTGIAWIVTGREIASGVKRVESRGRKGATLDNRNRRLSLLAGQIVEQACGSDLVVVEGPSYGQARQGGQHDRAGLWWLVVNLLTEAYGSVIVEVSPATRAKYATGRGNAAKDAVLAAVVKRYSGWDVTGNDVADALVLAAMGARHLGYPIETSLPATHLAAMAGVAWPTPEGTTA